VREFVVCHGLDAKTDRPAAGGELEGRVDVGPLAQARPAGALPDGDNAPAGQMKLFARPRRRPGLATTRHRLPGGRARRGTQRIGTARPQRGRARDAEGGAIKHGQETKLDEARSARLVAQPATLRHREVAESRRAKRCSSATWRTSCNRIRASSWSSNMNEVPSGSYVEIIGMSAV
jgi:hypothetical protein